MKIKKRVRHIIALLLPVCVLSFMALHANANSATAKNFANRVCQAWNNSALPQKLGSTSQGGSGWIDVNTNIAAVPSGTQMIASGRYDCSQTPEYVITIVSQGGRAVCSQGDVYNGKRTWQFLPTTVEYSEYAKSFGMGAFYKLWSNGMEGDKATAWKNSDHFQLFFNRAVKVGGDYLEPGCKK